MALFQRGLSAEFLAWLANGAGRSFLDALLACGLDIRLRGDYFNTYEAQSSVAKVTWSPRSHKPRIEVSAAYVVGTPFARRADGYVSFVGSDEAVAAYARVLPAICKRVREKHSKIEGKWEAEIVRTNQTSTPFVVVDRQIQSGGQRKRLDVLAVSRASREPHLVAVEIKRDLDNRIQLVPLQVEKYLEMLDPRRDGLRADIADSYVKVCAQLAALGLPGPSPSLIRAGMCVEGLVALARYNQASALLGRARKRAEALERTIWFCTIEDANPRIPPRADWFR